MMNNPDDLMSWPITELKILSDIDAYFSDTRLICSIPNTNKRALQIIDWAIEFNNRHQKTEWGVEASYAEEIDYFIDCKLSVCDYKAKSLSLI